MTYARSSRPVLMLNGLWADDVTLTVQQNTYETSIFEFGSRVPFSRGFSTCRLWCRFISTADNALTEIWEASIGESLVGLGSGNLCSYCGAYNCAGIVRCYACGGETEIFPFLSVRNFPFLCSSYTIEGGHGAYMVLEMDFISYEDPVFEIDYIDGGITFGALSTFPNHCTLFPDLNLCEFCGTIVEGNRSCPNCGGQRFPWSELIKMDRKCLYCGKKVVGGIVCQSCGASIAGTAIKSVLGEQSWLKNALTV